MLVAKGIAMLQSATMSKELEQWQKDDAARLKRIFQKSGLSQTTIGLDYGIGGQAMVGQYLNGKRPLNLKAAGKFAFGLKCRIDDFSPSLANQVRELHELVSIRNTHKKAKA